MTEHEKPPSMSEVVRHLLHGGLSRRDAMLYGFENGLNASMVSAVLRFSEDPNKLQSQVVPTEAAYGEVLPEAAQPESGIIFEQPLVPLAPRGE